MKRLILAVALAAASLSACTPLTSVLTGGPVTASSHTKLDEQAGITVTLAYTAAAKAAALAIQLADKIGHPLSATTVTRIGQLDNAAYQAVLGVRQAYLAANATSYAAAIEKANAAIGQIMVAIGARTSEAVQTTAPPYAYDAVVTQLRQHELSALTLVEA